MKEKPVFVSATDGNHGYGLAYAAKLLGCECIIYMPVVIFFAIFYCSLWLRCAISIYSILQNFPNYNVLINSFDNYSSNSIMCDDLKQKNLHTLSNY